MATEDLPIPSERAIVLLAAGGWSRSIGISPGKHWRKSVDGYGSLHLRYDAWGIWWLHRDDFDPSRFPLEHACEAVVETLACLFNGTKTG